MQEVLVAFGATSFCIVRGWSGSTPEKLPGNMLSCLGLWYMTTEIDDSNGKVNQPFFNVITRRHIKSLNP